MADKLSPAGLFAKWVVVPGLLVLVGYYFVGPRIGKSAKIRSGSAATELSDPQNADPPAPAKPSAKGLDVDVTVKPAIGGSAGTEVASTTPKPPRRRHHKPPPKDTDTGIPKPKLAKPPGDDEGGSAGSTTAG